MIQAIRHGGDLQMPPDKKLPAEVIRELTDWVASGAAWPNELPAKPADASQAHWAFAPVKKPVPPVVKDAAWAATPIDRFILAKLESKQLKPSPPAAPRDLIRRLAYDLTGLPPTAKEVEEFVRACATAPSGAANSQGQIPDRELERLVDRLLASPHYGERWGRLWLDVARYADTKGYVFEEDRRYPFAYTYRDYVIRSLNQDLPYDRFIIDQIAADALPPTLGNEHLAAMGFLTVGRRFLKDNNEIIDDRIDVVTRGFLGLTVGCARCHDHKFDPIPAADYYALYGVFASSAEPDNLPIIGLPAKRQQFEDFEKKSAAVDKKVKDFLAARQKAAADSLNQRVDAYLLAGFDLNWKVGGLQGLRDQSKARNLNPEALRWFMKRFRPFVVETKPEFALWARLARLKPAEFAAKAPEVVEKTRRDFPKDALAQAVCLAVAQKKPASMRELVNVYASLLAKSGGPFQEWLKRPESPTVVPIDQADQLPVERKVKLQLEALKKEQTTLAATHPGSPDKAMVMKDAPQPYQPYVFLRGNPGRRGPTVPRQFLSVVAGPHRQPFKHGSGRLELAQAIASPSNPLTARVAVNRVWAWHFGAGIVRTPSDFGTRGDPPTHPELLDYLAARFVENGWSLKKLHREIVMSRAYRQASAARPDGMAIDPDNMFVWRFNRRRLDWESLRDSLLVAAGRLDRTIGGRGVSLTSQPFTARRAVYGWIDRQNLEGIFRTFDFAGPNAHSPQRFATTQPQQGLFLLNGPFVLEQSRHIARNACNGLVAGKAGDSVRLVSTAGSTSAAGPALHAAEATTIAERLYRAVLGRSPKPAEAAAAREFLIAETVAGDAQGKPVAGSQRIEDAAERLAQSLLLTNEFMFLD